MRNCEVEAIIETVGECATLLGRYVCIMGKTGWGLCGNLFNLQRYSSTWNSSVDKVAKLPAERSVFDFRQGVEVLLLLYSSLFFSLLLLFLSLLLLFSSLFFSFLHFSLFFSFLLSSSLLISSHFFSLTSWPVLRTSRSLIQWLRRFFLRG